MKCDHCASVADWEVSHPGAWGLHLCGHCAAALFRIAKPLTQKTVRFWSQTRLAAFDKVAAMTNERILCD